MDYMFDPSKKENRQTGWVPRAPTVTHSQTHRYGTIWVDEAQKKWYSKHNQTKYATDGLINWECLQKE